MVRRKRQKIHSKEAANFIHLANDPVGPLTYISDNLNIYFFQSSYFYVDHVDFKVDM
jgi:hypothetical protein